MEKTTSLREKAMNGVGRQRVIVTDEETGRELGRGVLRHVHFGVGDDRMANESEIVIAADLPPKD